MRARLFGDDGKVCAYVDVKPAVKSGNSAIFCSEKEYLPLFVAYETRIFKAAKNDNSIPEYFEYCGGDLSRVILKGELQAVERWKFYDERVADGKPPAGEDS